MSYPTSKCPSGLPDQNLTFHGIVSVDLNNSESTEATPLLLKYPSQNKDFAESSTSSSWYIEAKVLCTNSSFLVLASILQFSLSVTGILIAGYLGPSELGAVSLASVTANVTGLVIYQGLATALDTLCAQAYGSGNPKLVGLHVQRMVCLFGIITIPVAIFWLNASKLLCSIIPDPVVAGLAGRYLKVLVLGAPGIALFEAEKRFLQAQGYFAPILYALGIAACANAFLGWLFIWVSHIVAVATYNNHSISRNAETVLWLHWRTSISRSHLQSSPYPSDCIRRPQTLMPAMLARNILPNFGKLGSYDPPCSPQSLYDRS
jgi:MatE